MSRLIADSTPTVILSGPTRGLGLALFELLTSKEYPLVCLGRDLGRITYKVKSATVPIEFVEFELGADPEVLANQLLVLRRTIQSTSSTPLVFISNASTIEPIGRATNLMPAELERTLNINCVAPLMIANTLTDIANAQQRRLLVLDVTTGAADRPIRGWQAYCTSKAAYRMSLDVLAAENSHVHVVHFDPGVIDTSMQELIRGQCEEDMPDVAGFCALYKEGLLKAPLLVAAELIDLMAHHLS